ncbi:MAG: Monomeric sarcosine oxidase [uncultured Rubrobacteraceae bacterium]|uniref:Monomeric sarcosine oxidase n=1 Tax=uncultured Rubrobacteraceae bacterium TaxID=349277 RepID=A0A6J4R742_9ACTN|nr:MAG: Monomeric sarcosine oxidase [uncultured Rubrobacteraceae bacterium]
MSVTYSGRYDAIVVGVGGMGSAASYYLARRGKRVLGLERFGLPHAMGSSHGHTRIIRLAYYEDPSYVLLLRRAYELWREIQDAANERLLYTTGSVDSGPEDSWVFKGSWESCKLHDLPHEVLTGSELHRRHPGYRLPDDHLALVQPDGGFLAPEKCIVSYVTAAQAHGAEIHARERVLEWEPLEGGVRVRTDRGSYEADKLVVTAGAWDGELVDVLSGLAVPERQVLAWLQPTRPERFRAENFPVFNLLVDEGRFYGFPVHGVPGFKFGKYHHLEEVVDPETLDRETHDYDEQLLRDFAERYFPDGCGPTMDLQTCMFTNTPDNHFVIDLHPDYEQVSFASPCSGHGYKFASVIGEVMADLADTGLTRHDISLFRLDRLTQTARRPSTPSPSTDGQAPGRNGHSRSFPRVPDVRPFW